MNLIFHLVKPDDFANLHILIYLMTKGKSIQFNNALFGLQNKLMAYEYGRRLSGVFETKRGWLD